MGPEDGGDFGPFTQGTKTAGIQEALDYAHENFRDVYIWGGRGGVHGGIPFNDNVYFASSPIRVPWNQDIKVDGGNYVLAYTGDSGPALNFDSQMNCRYKFGIVVSTAPDPVVRIAPETEGPDDFVVVTASVFDFSAPVSSHPSGIGIRLDSSKGPITMNKIRAEETNTQGTGVFLSDNGGTGRPIVANEIDIPYTNQHHSTGTSTGLRVGDPGSVGINRNILSTSLHAPRAVYWDEELERYVPREGFEVPEDAIGVDIFAQNNLFTLSFFGKRKPGKDIVFEPSSMDNLVFCLNGPPHGYTNRATKPTNRIIPASPVGFNVSTPPFPDSGSEALNDTAYRVEVLILSRGTVSEWTVFDANRASQTIRGGLVPGQAIVLEPGESLAFRYRTTPTWKAPAWRWKALS